VPLLTFCFRFTWATFVGLMVARVSRGRTIRELVVYCMVVPIVACLVWFSIWGGTGLRQSRQAMELEILGGIYFNDSSYFLASGSEVCYDVPQKNLLVNGEVVFTNYLPGVTPVCQFDPDKPSTASFNVLYSFSFPESFSGGGYGPPLAVFYIIVLTLFIVTSMDSTSVIVDHLASNGRRSHHWIRRVFWTMTQGTLATALLSAGGATALKAVQAASIACGLPCVVLLLFFMQSITLFCRAAEKLSNDEDYEFPNEPEFTMPVYGGICNIMEFVSSLGRVNKTRVESGIGRPVKTQVIEFLKGLFVPFVSLYQTLSAVYPTCMRANIFVVVAYGLSYCGWILMFSLSGSYFGLLASAATLFVVCGAILGKIRSGYRSRFNIRSNTIADFVSGLFLWPQVLAQMRLHCLSVQKVKEKQEEVPQPWNAEAV
jgi:BCCT, betaine/carnitine/choline family transporter